MDRHILPPAGLNMNRLMDYSPVKPGLRVHNSQKAFLFPQQHGCPSHQVTVQIASMQLSGTTVLKGSLKRSLSHSSPPVKIKEEGRDLCVVELSKKRQRVETENAQVGNKTDSPPMPVIDNVFSLAPYQAYLQASGVLFPGKVPHRTVQSSEHSEVKTKPDTKEKRPDGEKQQSVVCPVSKEIFPDTPSEKPVVEIMEPKNIKVENVDPSDTDNTAESRRTEHSSITVKKELVETGSCDIDPVSVIKKCEPEEPESKTCLPNESDTSDESAWLNTSSQDDACTLHEQVAARQSKPSTSPQPFERKLNFKNIPPQCLKLSTYKIILPDMKHSTPVQPPEKPPSQPTTDLIPKVDLQLPVRKHFLELHHSLCKLVSKSVSASSEQELRTWLSQLKLTEPESPPTKVQKVSCLLGVKAREVWLNEEIELALHNVTERLREYTIQKRCPFPHVMRTGAVFLPMLVMKEILFPMVQSSFIDQVLQEHRVELRPTTLSEEKILIQLHKRACSSRLRRLMSLKHLPDIYADVISLLYYACVCKHLGLDVKDPSSRDKDDSSEETSVFSDIPTSSVSPSESHSLSHSKDQETKSDLNRDRIKSRVKSSSRRMFLDNSVSDEDEPYDAGKTVNGVVLDEFRKTDRSADWSEESENRGSYGLVAEQDSLLILQNQTSDNSWMCPLNFDEISPSPSDTETQEPSSLQPGDQSSEPEESLVRSKKCSGVILKLRRMFSEGFSRKKASYQAVSNLGTLGDASLSPTEELDREVSSGRDLHRRMPKVNHSAEHRRRWVLRSAVQRARRAMRLYYPDLVGKRIRHLYEEDDKSEVWYRGEVLRIHEAHTNPLKTVFEV
ncbi:hypothetical protein INR49_010829, partial [Caranx melampygus]